MAIYSLWTIAALGSRIAWVGTPATWIVMLLIMSRLLLSFTLYHRERSHGVLDCCLWYVGLILAVATWSWIVPLLVFLVNIFRKSCLAACERKHAQTKGGRNVLQKISRFLKKVDKITDRV